MLRLGRLQAGCVAVVGASQLAQSAALRSIACRQAPSGYGVTVARGAVSRSLYHHGGGDLVALFPAAQRVDQGKGEFQCGAGAAAGEAVPILYYTFL